MIDASDLLDPTGDIQPGMFPSDDASALNTKLNAYVDRAYAYVTDLVSEDDLDEAAKQYTYYLAYSAVADRLASTLASASLTGLGSASVSATQVSYYRDKAMAALGVYEALLLPDDQPVAAPTSAAAKTVVTW